MKKVKVIVAVGGGVVQGCRSTDPNVEIEVFDQDNLKEEGKYGGQINKMWETRVKRYPHAIY